MSSTHPRLLPRALRSALDANLFAPNKNASATEIVFPQRRNSRVKMCVSAQYREIIVISCVYKGVLRVAITDASSPRNMHRHISLIA